jgi:hypothetical protein
MQNALQSVIQRGDLAHLALFLWAASASGLLVLTLREAASQARRVDRFLGEFLTELSRFNQRIEEATRDAHQDT